MDEKTKKKIEAHYRILILDTVFCGIILFVLLIERMRVPNPFAPNILFPTVICIGVVYAFFRVLAHLFS